MFTNSRAAAAWATLATVLCLGLATASATVVYETVTVGNPGNLGEWSGESQPINAGTTGNGLTRWCGAVNYTFEMGKHEVTAGQYVEFLNAVAASDPYGLYHTDMWDAPYKCNIQRSGVDGSYTYAVADAANWANRPVGWIEWGSAVRFANWMHNGQPTGPCGPATTEDGSYPILGHTTNPDLQTVVRRPGATWVLPSEDEWYKAAYHWNDGVTGNYWNYPTQFGLLPDGFYNFGPHNDVISPDPGNNSNHYIFGNPEDWCIGPPYFRTPVGEFENSASAYGTFDQGGNQWEWTDSWPNLTGTPGSKRIMRGGSFYPFIDDFLNQHAARRGETSSNGTVGQFAAAQMDRYGFRLAKVAGDCNGNGILDQVELRNGTSHDYNFNGIPDECDIAAATSEDCNNNGTPDEAEVGDVTVPAYRWSDGEFDLPFGMVTQGYMAWLNYYATVQGRETISAIAITFDSFFVPPGSPVTAYLWADPDSDGNPDDATVLASVPATVDGDELVVDIPDTYIGPAGTGFFVGAVMLVQPEVYPAAFDMDSDHLTSWMASSGEGGQPIDPNNLAAFSLYTMYDFGYPGNWLVDALSPLPVTPADGNDNGIPDSCEWQSGVGDDVPGAVGIQVSVHPNPFNPTTSIRFEVPVAGHVSVQVFDLTGRLVRTLVDGSLDAAPQVVPWDGSDDAGQRVASGAYYCRVTTLSGAATAKMMLLK